MKEGYRFRVPGSVKKTGRRVAAVSPVLLATACTQSETNSMIAGALVTIWGVVVYLGFKSSDRHKREYEYRDICKQIDAADASSMDKKYAKQDYKRRLGL